MNTPTLRDRVDRIEEDVGRLADLLHDMRFRRLELDLPPEPEPPAARCPFLRLAEPVLGVVSMIALTAWIARGCP